MSGHSLAERDDLWQVVMAYRLPAFALVTSGNDALDYRAWRRHRGRPEPTARLDGAPLQRRGQRLSRDHFLPRGYLPRVHLELADEHPTGRAGLPLVDDALALRISAPPEDRWVLDSTFYEIGFYVDYRFHSEEEQGFMPMHRVLDTSELAPGRHVATVQLFGFGGFIGSWSLEFERSRPR